MACVYRRIGRRLRGRGAWERDYYSARSYRLQSNIGKNGKTVYKGGLWYMYRFRQYKEVVRMKGSQTK